MVPSTVSYFFILLLTLASDVCLFNVGFFESYCKSVKRPKHGGCKGSVDVGNEQLKVVSPKQKSLLTSSQPMKAQPPATPT